MECGWPNSQECRYNMYTCVCVRACVFDVKPFKMLICYVSVSHEKQNELNRLCVCAVFYSVSVAIYPSCVDMLLFIPYSCLSFYTHFVYANIKLWKVYAQNNPPPPPIAIFPSVSYFFHLALIIAIVPTHFHLALFLSVPASCVSTRTLSSHTHRCWFDLTKWCFYVRVLIEYVRLFVLSHQNEKNISRAFESGVDDDDDDVDDGTEINSKKAFTCYIQESERLESESESNDRMLLCAHCLCVPTAIARQTFPFWMLT